MSNSVLRRFFFFFFFFFFRCIQPLNVEFCFATFFFFFFFFFFFNTDDFETMRHVRFANTEQFRKPYTFLHIRFANLEQYTAVTSLSPVNDG